MSIIQWSTLHQTPYSYERLQDSLYYRVMYITLKGGAWCVSCPRVMHEISGLCMMNWVLHDFTWWYKKCFEKNCGEMTVMLVSDVRCLFVVDAACQWLMWSASELLMWDVSRWCYVSLGDIRGCGWSDQYMACGTLVLTKHLWYSTYTPGEASEREESHLSYPSVTCSSLSHRSQLVRLPISPDLTWLYLSWFNLTC